MRILMIIFCGILSYIIVFSAGYFLFLHEDDRESVLTKKINEIVEMRSSSKQSEGEISLSNPGDAPPVK